MLISLSYVPISQLAAVADGMDLKVTFKITRTADRIFSHNFCNACV